MPTSAGGRRTPVFLRPRDGARYMPHLRVGGAEHLGVMFVDGPPVTTPGEEAVATAGLMYEVDYSALQPGAEFEVLEGLRRVASGRVLRRWTEEREWAPGWLPRAGEPSAAPDGEP
jgi:hypothetical protein